VLNYISVIFNEVFVVKNVNCKKESQPQVIWHAGNFGWRSLCCHLLSLLLIFKKSEEAVLLHS
jgi:hypothetical protein